MTRRSLLAVVTAFALLGGCEDGSRPVDPVWGKQSCGHCRMLVSDPRFAAQLVTADGQREFFDDVGCLAERLESTRPRHAWVRGESGAWIPPERARFATGAATPMDYGFVTAGAGTLDFDAVRRGVRARRSEGRER